MDSSIKFWKAIDNLKKGTEYTFSGDVPLTEELFDNINWKKDNGTFTTTNPHSELTWSKVDTEIKRLQTEYDALDYARKRKAEYPSIEELVVALYDAEDKTAVDEKRAAVKAKYSKPQETYVYNRQKRI